MRRVSLLRQVRMLGIREGFRTWRLFAPIGPDADRLPAVRIHHGDRPKFTGYRRRVRS